MITAMITCFAKDGSLDISAIQEGVRFQIASGAAGLCPLGGTGEPLSMTLDEHIATPHVAAFTDEAILRETMWRLEDTGRVLTGLEPTHMPPTVTGGASGRLLPQLERSWTSSGWNDRLGGATDRLDVRKGRSAAAPVSAQ